MAGYRFNPPDCIQDSVSVCDVGQVGDLRAIANRAVPGGLPTGRRLPTCLPHIHRDMLYMSRMSRSVRVLAVSVVVGFLSIAPLRPDDSRDADLERQFDRTVRPFLAQYCATCHGTSTPAAQFDIRSYST